MTKIFLHGSGHQAASWRETIAQMPEGAEILRPNLAALLEGKPARFDNLSASFAEYCAPGARTRSISAGCPSAGSWRSPTRWTIRRRCARWC